MPKSRKRTDSVPSNVVNKSLYKRIRARVKRSVNHWPSAYASGQVVREYKRQGGKYRSRKYRSKSGRKTKRSVRKTSNRSSFVAHVGRSKRSGLGRWFAEEWIDVCTGKPCGRRSARSKNRRYPYCRPKRRITSKTPRTARSLTKEQKRRLCAKKRRSPKQKMKSLIALQ